MCISHLSIIYVSDFLHISCTYRLPDMYGYGIYSTDIWWLQNIYRYCPIYILYLSDICPISIIIYRVSNMFMIYNRYFTARYVYRIYAMSIIYLSDFLHKYYTYQVPDMYVQCAYSRHICHQYYTHRVPDMYPICTRQYRF